ncbi:MAG: FliA/WhiG family RNA polymerase sigma factor [Candidatus Binatia bacterium]|nr:FliA/WhiG family RNA polymerase sigma factor [Candidatus Binatia bacterium]
MSISSQIEEGGGPAVAPPPISDDTVRKYLPLVRRVVRRLTPRKPPGVEDSELVSWGLGGLLDALQRFDPSKAAAFETYAQVRIRGAILDRLRGQDTTARSTREKAKLLEKTYQLLETRHGRAATEEEVAEELGKSLPELHAILGEIGRGGLLSLEDLSTGRDGKATGEEVLASDSLDPEDAVLERERVEFLAKAVDRLPQKERTVIELYYHEGLTMREAGEVLDLTESRVSQLHSRALLRLRGFLRESAGKR